MRGSLASPLLCAKRSYCWELLLISVSSTFYFKPHTVTKYMFNRVKSTGKLVGKSLINHWLVRSWNYWGSKEASEELIWVQSILVFYKGVCKFTMDVLWIFYSKWFPGYDCYRVVLSLMCLKDFYFVTKNLVLLCDVFYVWLVCFLITLEILFICCIIMHWGWFPVHSNSLDWVGEILSNLVLRKYMS